MLTFKDIIKMLPREPRPATVDSKLAVWTDGEDIFTKVLNVRPMSGNEMETFQLAAANTIADFIEILCMGDDGSTPLLTTGYYDPKVDEEWGTVTEHTGGCYIGND